MSSLRRYLNLPSKRLIRERRLSRTATVNPQPLFIFGNQKSGTTAVAALLAEATGVSVTLDFAGAWGRHAQALIRGKTPDTQFVRTNAWAFSAGIIKEPNLTFAAPRLLEHFKLKRAIFVVREPCANIRSILARLKLPGDRETLTQSEWRRIGPEWRMILLGQDIGFENDHYVEALALRWKRAAEIYGQLRSQLRLVRYEDFNADKTGSILALARDFSLPVTADITPSLDREFQPRAAAEWNALKFFGQQNLERIARICTERASELGYRIPCGFG